MSPTVRRSDIDGLRAIAVIAVLLFHLRVPGFAGGFVGVDVFFVISGYLITSIIWKALDAGRFSLSGFYFRRFYRLIPALAVVVGLTLPAAFLMLSPELLASFAKSAPAALFGVSNILYWIESDYFDTAARLKPLLHTWSLSVEWQFYAVWPFLILMLHRFAKGWLAPTAIVMIGILSLAASLAFQDGYFTPVDWIGLSWLIADGPSTIFYNMPFRIFEFAAGAILCWLPRSQTSASDEFSVIGGTALITYAVFTFGEGTLFPGLNALFPAIGTALVICGGRARFSASVFRAAPVVYMGRISYAVYLVHWPMIVFWEAYTFTDLSPYAALAIGFMSVALGAALHHAVELPFQRARAIRGPVIGGLLATTLIFALPASSTGMPWRMDANASALGSGANLDEAGLSGSVGCEVYCTFGKEGRPKVLILGDSHIDHLTRALEQDGGNRFEFHLVYSPSCFVGASLLAQPQGALGQQCADTARQLQRVLSANEFQAIIIGQRWPGYRSILTHDGEPFEEKDLTKLFPMMLDDLALSLSEFEGPIVLVGHAPTTNRSCYRRPTYLPLVCPATPLWEHADFQAAVTDFMNATALDVRAVMPVDILCSGEVCETVDEQGRPLYTDDHHLSIFGASRVSPQILSAVSAPR